MQAYALLAAAHGALEAFKGITGDDWVAYQAHDEAQGALQQRSLKTQLGIVRVTAGRLRIGTACPNPSGC